MSDTSKYNNNYFSDGNSTPETLVIINCVLNAPLMLISILGNVLVLAAIIRTTSIRSTSMIMLCSLAVSDLLVGFLAQPIYIAKELTRDLSVHNAWMMIGPSLCAVSFLTITAITVDRFLALHYHMRYSTLVTKYRVKYTLVFLWLISFLISGFHLWISRIHTILVAFGTITCLIISAIFYIRIYLIVRRHQLQIHAQQQAVQSFNTENINLNVGRLKRSAVSTFVFYAALVLCYFPMYVILTLHGVAKNNWQVEWNFVESIIFMNSSINPLLYCWRLRKLRTAVVKTARQVLCKQTEEN